MGHLGDLARRGIAAHRDAAGVSLQRGQVLRLDRRGVAEDEQRRAPVILDELEPAFLHEADTPDPCLHRRPLGPQA